jgi:hypothetical protein
MVCMIIVPTGTPQCKERGTTMSTMTLESFKWEVAEAETRMQAAVDAAIAREIHARELAAVIGEEIGRLRSMVGDVEEPPDPC